MNGDVSPLDRAISYAASYLYLAGWTEASEKINGDAAYLRETPCYVPEGATPLQLFDALMTISDSAKSIADTIASTYPDDLALRSRFD